MMNATKEFQKFANQYNEMMMDSWSSWTKETVQSDSFAAASGAFMDWSLASHKMMTDLSGQVMESMDIPKRSDLARLSAQVQAVEARLLEQDDQQEDIKELLLTLLQKMEEKEAATAPQTKVQAEVAPAPEKPASKSKPSKRATKKSAEKATKKIAKKSSKK